MRPLPVSSRPEGSQFGEGRVVVIVAAVDQDYWAGSVGHNLGVEGGQGDLEGLQEVPRLLQESATGIMLPLVSCMHTRSGSL